MSAAAVTGEAVAVAMAGRLWMAKEVQEGGTEAREKRRLPNAVAADSKKSRRCHRRRHPRRPKW